jgi:hypothetical protein
MFSVTFISHLLYDPHRLKEEAAALSLKSGSAARSRKVLARAAEGHDIHRRKLRAVKLRYIPDMLRIGKVPL